MVPRKDHPVFGTVVSPAPNRHAVFFDFEQPELPPASHTLKGLPQRVWDQRLEPWRDTIRIGAETYRDDPVWELVGGRPVTLTVVIGWPKHADSTSLSPHGYVTTLHDYRTTVGLAAADALVQAGFWTRDQITHERSLVAAGTNRCVLRISLDYDDEYPFPSFRAGAITPPIHVGDPNALGPGPESTSPYPGGVL